MLTIIVTRIRAEYLEMPGLRLTPAQAQRLFGAERGLCQAALDTLVGAGFLSVKPDGTYARLANEDLSRPRPAKADHASKRRAKMAS